AIGDRMEDEIEGAVFERKTLRHVALDDLDVVALALGNPSLAGQLPIGLIEYRRHRAQRREDRHLLAAAAGKTEQPGALQAAEPSFWDEFARGEIHAPVA